MSIFVLKIHHYVRFFVHGFRFLRERVYLRCTKIVRLKCWRGFNMLCSSCFLSWQEVWTALRFSPVGRFRSPTRFASPVSGRRFRHTIVSRRQSSPATLRSKIPSNPPPRRRSSACAMIPGRGDGLRAVVPSGLFGLLRPASQAGRLLCLFAGAYPDLAAFPVPVLPHVPG